jgi:octaprenyl-diphosphate synthase
MTVLTTHDSTLRGRLDADLQRVRRLFSEELKSDLDCVNELAGYAQRYHGKMLRPMLVLMTAMAVEPRRDRTETKHLIAAAVVEMVHMATLVHDDILDEAQMRRRGPTINHLRGNEAAVMLGDYLISHAYHLCSSLGSPNISRIIAHATNTVCEGELLQLSHRHDLGLDEPTYFKIITRKTASLCGACCRATAELSGCGPAMTDALYVYGETLGIAFQIIDDVLDLTGDPQTVGKTLGRDLAKGKLTLPLIHAIASCGSARRIELVSLLREQADPALSEEGSSAGAARVRELLLAGDSLVYAREKAVRLTERAKSGLLEHLEDSAARSSLLGLADSVVSRSL